MESGRSCRALGCAVSGVTSQMSLNWLGSMVVLFNCSTVPDNTSLRITATCINPSGLIDAMVIIEFHLSVKAEGAVAVGCGDLLASLFGQITLLCSSSY